MQNNSNLDANEQDHLKTIQKKQSIQNNETEDNFLMLRKVLIYEDDIYEYFTKNEQEIKFSINDYLINEKIRQTTILNLKRICNIFDLCEQTYFLSVHLLQYQIIYIKNPRIEEMEIISLTCLFICQKFEEIDFPPLKFIFDKTLIKKKEVIEKEQEILQLINYKIMTETTFVWIKLFLQKLNCNLQSPAIFSQIMQNAKLSLLFTPLLNFKKSSIALGILLEAELRFGLQNTQFQWERLTLHKKPRFDSQPFKLMMFLTRHYK